MSERKRTVRVLHRLAASSASLAFVADGELGLLSFPNGQKLKIERSALEDLKRRDLLKLDRGSVVITSSGRSHLKRAKAEGEVATAFIAQNAEAKHVSIDGQRVLRNAAESPLARLRALKSGAGGQWLSNIEFEAGERLRVDFERAQIRQRVTMSYDPTRSSGSGRSTGTPNNVAEMSDNALASRARMNEALDALGPELCGVAMDVCCFLKGLEAVETERGWPRRSAKLLLKAALGVLGRHYFPSAIGKTSGGNHHWGAPDFRPNI
ncbi:MAG: DUF6456 domain-containing protein [Pseudomonadota bacterium]